MHGIPEHARPASSPSLLVEARRLRELGRPADDVRRAVMQLARNLPVRLSLFSHGGLAECIDAVHGGGAWLAGEAAAARQTLNRRSRKPTPLEFSPDGFPAELKELKRFTHWMFQRKDKKWSKVPRCRSQAGSSTNPNTWMTFDYALKYFLDRGQKNGLDGLGFVFSKDDPFCGVDLDDCRDPATGEVDAWASAIVATLDSYTEVSPTGTGLKVWVRARKPPGRSKVKYESGEVEVYDQGRYFCMTGHRLEGTPATVNERDEQLAAVYLQVFGKAQSANDKAAGTKVDPFAPQAVNGSAAASAL